MFPAVAAGAFTTNVVKATSVTRNMKIMEGKGKNKRSCCKQRAMPMPALEKKE